MSDVYNNLIDFGKKILNNTDYLSDKRWIDGLKQFYNERYGELVKKTADDLKSDRITNIILSQFEYIDAEAFWTFFAHYSIRLELMNFESMLKEYVEKNTLDIDVDSLECKFDDIIDKFNSDYIDQEQEWLSDKITSINRLLSKVRNSSVN